MKTSETEAIVLAILAALSTLSSAVLTGYEHGHITEDRKFGCIWAGGTYPAVNCTCQEEVEMYITEKSIESFQTFQIEINDCKKVRFGPKSIAEMRNLRHIKLRNIQSLEFEQSSLIWFGYRDKNQYEEHYDMSIPSLKIVIENCNISKISSYTFEGRINAINFDTVIIDNIDAYAFNSLKQTQQISIKNSELKSITLQAFKKFSTENLILDGVKAQLIPSRFLSEITVYEKFLIDHCHFDTVRSGAFIVNNPKKFEVTNTKINQLDGEAFKVATRSDVLFKNNNFDIINDGAFRGITILNKDDFMDDVATMTFDSNVFTTLTRDSLSVSDSFQPKFANLNINETCNCKSIDHQIKDTEFYKEIKCLYDDEFVTVEEYKANMCSLMKSYATTIVIVAVVFTLCFIIGTVLVVYYRKVHLSKKYGNEKNPQKGNMSLIVPDGRTYRETELHVIVERNDLLTTDL